ncbi:DUF1127 domain-containing protein [Hwanghaeella grinnelliae]|uniref:DUF1127 domain-containing protein n=1 Tax=Hwanghaeella grinnelliae TaxID=2500179 RepID=UPI001387592A|nr:DUF1127 domain-containing protein [Hwanghaeella grinnelliae]
MQKTEFAEWIRQTLFPAQIVEPVGNVSLHYRVRTNASLHVGSLVSGTVVSVWTEVVRWHRARRAAAALMACSDTMLRDIGIDRSEIKSVVYDGDQGRRRGPFDFD